MSFAPRPMAGRALGALVAIAGAIAPGTAARAAGGGAGVGRPPSSGQSGGSGGSRSGGAPIGGLVPNPKPTHIPPPPSKHDHGSWVGGVTITEYWPAPEAWFLGRLVATPGLPGLHRIDWLYSATGVSMEGEGLGLDGRVYHINALGSGGWVTAAGAVTSPSDGWASGAPFWRAGGYWRSRSGGVTFPLQQRGWSAGKGRRYVPLRGVTFAAGPSLPLKYYQSIAVDPGVIPLGSRVYIPAYKRDRYGGWFVAQDTGGAIAGDHIDVYRTPPASPTNSGQYLVDRRAYVIPPRH